MPGTIEISGFSIRNWCNGIVPVDLIVMRLHGLLIALEFNSVIIPNLEIRVWKIFSEDIYIIRKIFSYFERYLHNSNSSISISSVLEVPHRSFHTTNSIK
jgi:hypothetical protein